MLQRQREVCVHEVTPVKEDHVCLEHLECYIVFVPTQHTVVMAVLEREQIDRWLHAAKTELFSEQRRSREKLESMQDVYLCLKL